MHCLVTDKHFEGRSPYNLGIRSLARCDKRICCANNIVIANFYFPAGMWALSKVEVAFPKHLIELLVAGSSAQNASPEHIDRTLAILVCRLMVRK